ncbi:lipopolysaccharide export system permease protein [Saccharicrinis carchari]|uniref:Lipopolysaccharide export system permease protein n=1 Tax=Saccharicrinis carchari TaxID=1168039 RepID=A0A521EP28_SACCC|nr:LptF/LptG family permease [Saccharicrinis carchari]SMO84890.1 lipopolysaccharide export system permease protein [Saccharicrinis carchari]
MRGVLQKLDRYIIRKFLGTYFFAILLIISIAVVFDITEKIDNFLEKEAPLNAIVFDYYFNFIPYFANLFTPLFVFIAVIFFTSKMAGDTEIIAILSGGVSFKRLMFPYFISALIVATFSFYLGAYVIPPSNKTRLEFESVYVKNKKDTGLNDIHLQLEPGLFVYMGQFYSYRNKGKYFSAERFEDKEMTSKLSAQEIIYQEDAGTWLLTNYIKRDFIDKMHIEISEGDSLEMAFNMTPADFKSEHRWYETMTNTELSEYIEAQTKKGVGSIKPYIIEYYKRWANPFSAFILTLIGVSLASRKVRGGIGLHIGIGLGLSFGYILFMTISTTFAINGNMNPIFAVWLPNLVFALIGVYLYIKAPK